LPGIHRDQELNLIMPPYAEVNGKPSRPSKAQAAFHAEAARGTRHVYFRAGLGAGKSYSGAMEFIRRILHNRAIYQSRGKSGELVYAALAPTYQLIDAGAWTHLLTILDSISTLNGFSLIKGKPQKTHPRRINLKTGDVIKFVATDAFRFAGQNVAGCWGDELEESESPREAFKLGKKRLRDARSPHLFYLVTSTPTVAGEGVSALFEERGPENGYTIIEGSTKDNPGIDPAYYEELRATMSESEALALLEGKPQPPSGTVFAREFCRRRSVAWDYTYSGPRGRRNTEIRLCIDWGGHFYCGMVEHHIDTGVDVVFDELYIDNCQDVEFLDAVCQRIKQRWGLSRRDVARVYCDSRPHTAARLAYSQRFFPGRVSKRNMTEALKRDGIEAVKHRLRDADGVRRLLIAPELTKDKGRGIYRSLGAYSYKKRIIDGREAVSSKVNQEAWSSHAVDALRYYIGYQYRFQTFREKVSGRVRQEARG
jgi:hypothetical protein